MYLLSQRNTSEFHSDLRKALLERGGYLGSVRGIPIFDPDFDRDVYEELKSRDPHYDPESALPELTVSMLHELHGEEPSNFSGHFGGHDPYGKAVDLTDSLWAEPRVKLHAARAMVLAAQPAALLDPIAARLTDEVLTRHSEGKRYCISVPTNAGVFTWRDMVKLGPLKDHFLPGQGRISLSGIERLDIEPTVRLGKEVRQQLRLRFDGKAGGILWEARGSSRLKKSHLRLVTELNAVLQDYQNRQQWADDYRNAQANGGYTSEQIEVIRRELRFYSDRRFYIRGSKESLDLSGLAPGVSLGNSPLMLQERWRGYYACCSSCGRVGALEVIVAKSLVNQPWNDLRSDAFYRHPAAEISLNSLLGGFHAQSGCAGTEALSSGTGISMPIEGSMS